MCSIVPKPLGTSASYPSKDSSDLLNNSENNGRKTREKVRRFNTYYK
jgi:hypothetical protein